MSEKGPTRAQLMARVAKLEAEISRLRAPDPVRRTGEHWYELVDLFDPAKIQALPVVANVGRTHVLGSLRDMLIVEFPASADPGAVRALLRQMAAQGAGPVFAVSEGVRFVRLRALDAAEERAVDEEVQRGEAAERAGSSGPEPHGDRMGGDLGRGQGARDGRDRDVEGEGLGAPDGGRG